MSLRRESSRTAAIWKSSYTPWGSPVQSRHSTWHAHPWGPATRCLLARSTSSRRSSKPDVIDSQSPSTAQDVSGHPQRAVTADVSQASRLASGACQARPSPCPPPPPRSPTTCAWSGCRDMSRRGRAGAGAGGAVGGGGDPRSMWQASSRFWAGSAGGGGGEEGQRGHHHSCVPTTPWQRRGQEPCGPPSLLWTSGRGGLGGHESERCTLRPFEGRTFRA